MLSISSKAGALGTFILSAAIILAGAVSANVSAQTPAGTDTSVKPAVEAVATAQPNEDERTPESKKDSTSLREKTSSEKISTPNQSVAIVPPVAIANSIEATFAAAAGKPSTLSKPVVTTKPQGAVDDDAWQFQVTPYFWLASLHGTGGIGNRTTEVDMSFGDIFGDLKFALMGVFEARKGKFVSLTDLEYVSIETERATPGPFFSSVTAGFKTFIFSQEVGYRFYEDPDKAAYVDVLGGVRVWHVSTDLNFGAGILPAQQIDGSRNWVDAIVGLRAKTAVSQKVFVNGKFDLGGGGSQFTWHLYAGGGYNINPKVALLFGYRVLDVDYDKNNFIYDMNQRGPIMGIGFKF